MNADDPRKEFAAGIALGSGIVIGALLVTAALLAGLTVVDHAADRYGEACDTKDLRVEFDTNFLTYTIVEETDPPSRFCPYVIDGAHGGIERPDSWTYVEGDST